MDANDVAAVDARETVERLFEVCRALVGEQVYDDVSPFVLDAE